MSEPKTWTYVPPECTCPEGATEHEDACPTLDIATFTIERDEDPPWPKDMMALATALRDGLGDEQGVVRIHADGAKEYHDIAASILGALPPGWRLTE